MRRPLGDIGFHDGLEQFDTDQHQHEHAKHIQQQIDIKQHIRRRDDVLNHEPAQIQRAQHQHNGHQSHQQLNQGFFKFFENTEQHGKFLYERFNGIASTA